MDHPTALRSQAVERYTLGELTSPEREAFEEHFFSCLDCTSALREYEIFIANTRAVFQDDAQPARAHAESSRQPGWMEGLRRWFAIPALALAGLALALVMLRAPHQPDINGPRAAWAMLPDARAGAVPHHKIESDVVWLAPSIKLQGVEPQRWASYHWDVKGENNRIVDQGDGHGAGTLNLKLPVSKFAFEKTYTVTVQGSQGTAPVVSSFVIEHN